MKKTVKLLCLSISLLLMLNIFTLYAPSGVFAANYYGFETAEEYEAAKKAAEEAAKKAAEEEAKKVAEEAAKKAAEEAANQKALEAKLEEEKKAAQEALKKAEEELRAIEEAEKRAEKLNRIRLENEIKKSGAINTSKRNGISDVFTSILRLFGFVSANQDSFGSGAESDYEFDYSEPWKEPEEDTEANREEVADNGSYTTLCLTHTLSENESYYIITGLNMRYAPAGQLNVAIPMAYYDIYMKEIADNAFRGSSMSNIEIPITITTIGSYAFADCKKLNKIRYQGTIRQWNNIEFGENWNYGENKFYVMCDDGILTQDDLNSYSGSEEEQEEVPDNGIYTSVCVTYAPGEDGSYYVITGLNMRNAPEGQLNIAIPTAHYGIYMREISDYAFCSSLISNIIIPESITKIGSYAFANCKKLNKIRYQGTMRQWVNLDFGKNWGAGTSGFDVVCNDGTFSY